MRSKSKWAQFLGKNVRIEWKDRRWDWHYFFVDSVSGEEAELVGIADMETETPHDGSRVVAYWREIKEVKEVVPPPDDSFSRMENGALEKGREIVDSRDKQAHYGPPEESMRRIGLIWSGILGVDVSAEKAALMMLGLKAARLSVDPRHFDSLVDSAGYVRILERLAKK